jgi:hypothetical protein
MKEKEIRQHAQCSLCKRKIGQGGIHFYTVRVEQYVIDPAAMRRQTGLAMAMGSADIAAVMGPDEDMAHRMSQVNLTVCGKCGISEILPVAALAERGSEKDDSDEVECVDCHKKWSKSEWKQCPFCEAPRHSQDLY